MNALRMASRTSTSTMRKITPSASAATRWKSDWVTSRTSIICAVAPAMWMRAPGSTSAIASLSSRRICCTDAMASRLMARRPSIASIRMALRSELTYSSPASLRERARPSGPIHFLMASAVVAELWAAWVSAWFSA